MWDEFPHENHHYVVRSRREVVIIYPDLIAGKYGNVTHMTNPCRKNNDVRSHIYIYIYEANLKEKRCVLKTTTSCDQYRYQMMIPRFLKSHKSTTNGLAKNRERHGSKSSGMLGNCGDLSMRQLFTSVVILKHIVKTKTSLKGIKLEKHRKPYSKPYLGCHFEVVWREAIKQMFVRFSTLMGKYQQSIVQHLDLITHSTPSIWGYSNLEWSKNGCFFLSTQIF